MNIGVYGGTFNPPHRGHTRVMEAVITQLSLERLILMPTGSPPHKELPVGTPDPYLRLLMTEKAGDTVAHSRKKQNKPKCVIEANDLEIRRQGKSFTIDTLETLQVQFPEDQLFLIMGEDMFMTFMDWASPEKIARRAKICTFLRNDQEPSEALQAQAQRVREGLNAEVILLRIPYNVNISSTEIRGELIQNIYPKDVLPANLGQMLHHDLYGVSLPSWENLDLAILRTLVWGQVHPKRIAHIMGVEQECAKLARRWGANEQLARRAGVLHDYSKYWSHQDHIDYCQQFAVPLDELEWSTEKLLHAKSGAAFARYILREEEEVWKAIDCHTTGKGDMSLMDKILYLADYIEPQRTFEEVVYMRQLAYEDIDKALAYGLYMSVEEMRSRNKVTHQNTLQGYEQYGGAQFATL